MAVEFDLVEAAFARLRNEASCLSEWKRKGKRQLIYSIQDVTHRIELVRFKHSFAGNQMVGVRAGVSFPCKVEPVAPADADEYRDGVASCFGYLTQTGEVVPSPAFNSGAIYALKGEVDVASWSFGLGERICASLVPWLQARRTATMAAARCIEAGSHSDILHIVLSYEGPGAARANLTQYLAECIARPDPRPRVELFGWAAKYGLIEEEWAAALARAVMQASDTYTAELERFVGMVHKPSLN